MIIKFIILWYVIGHLVTIPAIFKKRYPWDWKMWKFLFENKLWGKAVELFLMAVLIYPWFNPLAACLSGLLPEVLGLFLLLGVMVGPLRLQVPGERIVD